MFDKPKDQLQMLQQELLEVDPLDESEALYTDEKHFYSPKSDAEKNIRRRLEKENKANRDSMDSNQKKPKKKKKRSFLTFFTIVIEIILIVVLLRWWSQWLT